MKEDNFYERLEIRITATSDEIKSAFRRLAKEHHPDVNPCPGSKDKFISIQTAYEILINPDLRKNYNKSLREALAKQKEERTQELLFTIDTARKIEIILAWSTTRRSFNTSFVCSCLNNMAEGRELTERQLDSIDNIILSFVIDLHEWSNDDLREAAIKKYFDKEEAEINLAQDLNPSDF